MSRDSEPTRTIRVLLAEDHTIVRQGLRALLGDHDDIQVVAEAADGEQAVSLSREHRPDVVVMDLGMPVVDGIEATRRIRGELEATRVIALSMHDSDDYVRPAVRAGASGYLVKGAGLSDLVTAIRAVAAGGTFFSPSVVPALVGDPPADQSGPPALTERELAILRLVARGRSSAEIAGELAVSVKTVERHRSRIMSKFGVANVAALVRESIRWRLIDPAG